MKIIKKPNNTFCKELCVKCGRMFDADSLVIYECKKGYVCYDCIIKLAEYKKYESIWLSILCFLVGCLCGAMIITAKLGVIK